MIELLERSPLVTVTGTPGVGKSTLAQAVASEIARQSSTTTYSVDLSVLSTDESLAERIAAVARIRLDPTRDPVEVLATEFGTGDRLLVLDDCGHLSAAVSELVGAFLSRAASVRVIATSHVSLGVPHERVFRLGPLAIPVSENDLDCASTALFLERAEAIESTFTLGPGDDELVAGICRALDGLPLAIELAASLLRSLSLRELAEALDSRFELLAGLEAVMGRAYDGCDANLQTAWAALSVVPSSFGNDQAAAILAATLGDEFATIGPRAGLLGELVDRGLLIREPETTNARFRMLETIRSFGQRRLAESDFEDRVIAGWSGWAADLSQRIRSAWFGPEQRSLHVIVAMEFISLSRAIETCLSRPTTVDEALAIASNLGVVWMARSDVRHGRRLLGLALEASAANTAIRAEAVRADGWLSIMEDDYDGALARAEELGHLGELGVTPGSSELDATQLTLVARLYRDGPAPAVIDGLAELTARDREAGRLERLADDLLFGSVARLISGDLEGVEAGVGELLTICGDAGAQSELGYALWLDAILRWRKSQDVVSQQRLLAALRVARDVRDPILAAICLDLLVHLDVRADDLRTAARWQAAAGRIRQVTGLPMPYWRVLPDEPTHRFDGPAESWQEAIAAALDWLARPQPIPRAALSSRQREIATLVASGNTNKVIAEKLGLSPRTVDKHIENIMMRLTMHSRSQIAAWIGARYGAGDIES
jgi:predicted ATPase/DNA-binding CsgD family transcriptional regulator